MTARLGIGLDSPLFAIPDPTTDEPLALTTPGCEHLWDARWQCEKCATNHPALVQMLNRLNNHLIARLATPATRQNIARYILNSAVRAGEAVPDSPEGAQVAWEWLIRAGGKLRMDGNTLHVEIPRVTY